MSGGSTKGEHYEKNICDKQASFVKCWIHATDDTRAKKEVKEKAKAVLL